MLLYHYNLVIINGNCTIKAVSFPELLLGVMRKGIHGIAPSTGFRPTELRPARDCAQYNVTNNLSNLMG